MGMAHVTVPVTPRSLPVEVQGAVLARRRRVQWLVVRVAGSHSFGLDLPESDYDWSAVWSAPAREVLGLREPRGTYDGHQPDWVAHELGHWCRLLLKGNPSIVEDVLDPRAWIAPLFAPVRDRIREFVSKRTVEAYLGYARAQLHLLERGKKVHTTGGHWNPKFGVHLLRLLGEGLRLAKGQLPVVRLPDAERDALMLVRRGQASREEVTNRAVDMAQAIEDAKPWPWPDEPDEAALDSICADVRLKAEEEVQR